MLSDPELQARAVELTNELADMRQKLEAAERDRARIDAAYNEQWNRACLADARAHAAEDALKRAWEELRQTQALLMEVRDSTSAPVLDDARLNYVVVQIDRPAWLTLRAYEPRAALALPAPAAEQAGEKP